MLLGNDKRCCRIATTPLLPLYDGFNHLTSSVVGTTAIAYSYNAQGIRTSRQVGNTHTDYLLDGGNVVGEVTNGTVTTYLRGANLISSGSTYYLYNAHGDVVQLTSFIGAVTKTYDYDAFGNEKNPSSTDTNPFRYCGEYYDTKTGLYYLRARYYDPTIGRFTQEDTHWNTANMIYGDNPQKINEREDALGVKTYSYTPQISAIVQSGNLYVYAMSSPPNYIDPMGNRAKPIADQVIKNNTQYIIMAAQQFGLDPAILASTIYAEQRLNVDFVDDVLDGICGFYGIDTSIGVAQVRVSTAKFLEDKGYMPTISFTDGWWNIPVIGAVHGTETMARSKILGSPGVSIMYAAAYLRYFIDNWESSYLGIGSDTAILATLYNLGHIQTTPNSNPRPNDFGVFAGDNYEYMLKLLGLN